MSQAQFPAPSQWLTTACSSSVRRSNSSSGLPTHRAYARHISIQTYKTLIHIKHNLKKIKLHLLVCVCGVCASANEWRAGNSLWESVHSLRRAVPAAHALKLARQASLPTELSCCLLKNLFFHVGFLENNLKQKKKCEKQNRKQIGRRSGAAHRSHGLKNFRCVVC